MAQITYANKDKNAASGSAARTWRDVDANEVKTVVNGKADALEGVDSLSGGASASWDGTPTQLILTQNETVAFSTTQRTGFMIVKQDGTGGWTLTLGGQSVPVASGANAITIVTFIYNDVTSSYIFTYTTDIVSGVTLDYPLIISMSADAEDTITVVFDRPMSVTTAGWSFKKNGSNLAILGVSGGTDTWFFEVTTGLLSTDVLLGSYDATMGDTTDGALELESFTDESVTNSLSGPDADAQAYIAAEETAASIDIDTTNEDAISALFAAMKAGTNPYATKVKGIFLGYGTGLVNGKNLAVATGTNLPSIGAGGYTFDGTNDSINTGIVPNTDLLGGGVDTESYFIYAKSLGGVIMLGSRNSGSGTYIALNSSGDLVFRLGSAGDVNVAGAGGDGRFAIWRKQDTFVKALKNGVQVSNSTQGAASPSTTPIAFGSSNEDSSPSLFASGTVAALIIAADLTDAEATQIDTAVANFVTATSRT